MANKIQVKRGVEANLPTLDVGEPAFTTDTKKPFIGSNTGNVELATKAQINTLGTDVVAHKAETAKKHITDSGSNDDGYYMRFDDGNMICTGRALVSTRTKYYSTTHYDLLYGAMTFPKVFTTLPSVVATPLFEQSKSVFREIPHPFVDSTFAKATIRFLKMDSSFPEGLSLEVLVIAIGRWK